MSSAYGEAELAWLYSGLPASRKMRLISSTLGSTTTSIRLPAAAPAADVIMAATTTAANRGRLRRNTAVRLSIGDLLPSYRSSCSMTCVTAVELCMT
jgi:hypothetical protein